MTKSDATRLRNLRAKQGASTLTPDESKTLVRLEGLRDKNAQESLNDTVERARQRVADSKMVLAGSRKLIDQARLVSNSKRVRRR